MDIFLQQAKKTSKKLALLDESKRDAVLEDMAQALLDNCDYILEQNQKDIQDATTNNVKPNLLDRLLLNEDRIRGMSDSVREIAKLKSPLNQTQKGWISPDGLKINKISVPIGVIGIIYESRPNVTSECSALCFKSGNVCVLKGGKEAINSNVAIVKVLCDVLKKHNIDENTISLLPDYSRDGVMNLIKQNKYLDLIIPRGGAEFIKFIEQNSSVPIIKQDKGVCHTFIDVHCNSKMAIDISVNAKTNRPSVCNAMECLLVHKDIANLILPALKDRFDEEGTLLKGCEITRQYIDVQEACEDDFGREFGDNILAIKVVDDVQDAMEHIEKYSSNHSECIVTNDINNANEFLANVDSACVYVNASTRFSDGFSFGFGGEIGISTSKLHARGPMGLDELVSYKYQIIGQGQIK